MSKCSWLQYDPVPKSLLDSLPVALIDFLTSGEDYFASCNVIADFWWFLDQRRRCLLYFTKENQCIELPLPEAEMDIKLAVNLMNTGTCENFCCLSISAREGHHMLTMRYWPKVTKQRFAAIYTDWDLIECYDKIPTRLIGNDYTFVAFSTDLYCIFFSFYKTSKNELIPIIHEDTTAYNVRRPTISTLTRRLTSIIRSRTTSYVLSEKVSIHCHLTPKNALLCNTQYVFIWKFNDTYTEQFSLSFERKLEITILFQPCFNEMDISQNDTVTCIGMQGVNNTIHFLVNSLRYNHLLFHASAILNDDNISLLSLSRIDYPFSASDHLIFTVSSQNRLIMIRNCSSIFFSFGEKFRENLSFRVDRQLLSEPMLGDNCLWTVEEGQGLCQRQLCSPLYLSENIWREFKDLNEDQALLYSSLCAFMKNDDNESQQIMDKLDETADVYQIVAQLAVAICDIWITEIENRTNSDNFEEILNHLINNSTEKLALFEGLLNFLQGSEDQVNYVTFCDGTMKTLTEMMAILFEKINASIILFSSLKRLDRSLHQEILTALSPPFNKVTRISVQISNVLKLKALLPFEWVAEFYYDLCKLCNDIPEKFNALKKIAKFEWSIYNSDRFLCDLCDFIVHYIKQVESNCLSDLAYNFIDNFLHQVKMINSNESYKLLLNTILSALVECRIIDEAINIAKKHHDYHSLVDITLANDMPLVLAQLCEEFQEDFVAVLFEILNQLNKTGMLLNHPFISLITVQNEIRKHPNIFWIHLIRSGNYKSALTTVQSIALAEKRHCSKTMQLAICQLLCRLTDDNCTRTWLEKESFLSYAISILPDTMKQNIFENDVVSPSISDLIKHLCSVEIPIIKKSQCYSIALQATQFIEDSIIIKNRQVYVIARCLLCDKWKYSGDDVELALLNQHTQFMALLSYLHQKGINPALSICSNDIITSDYWPLLNENGIQTNMVSLLLDAINS